MLARESILISLLPTKTDTIEQDGIIKNDGNSASHKVETWEITIRKCLDCGLEVSRGSKVINTRREAHSFSRTYNSYGAVNTCSVCNYSKLSTQNEVWTDMNAFLQESAMDEITRWVMNQSGILTVSESSMKLPAVVGNPYEAIKKAVQQGITKDYYKLVDAKEDILDLYVLRVDVSGELHRAVANNSNATEEIMAIYSNIVDMEFDAVETYLQEQAKQQAGFLGDIGRFFGHGDNYTANEWLGSLHQDRELFTDVYRNAWTKAK